MEEIFKVNGKESKTKKWFRLNKKQVLEEHKGKSRIIYPFKIGEETIKSNLFFPEGFGKFIWMLLLVAGIILILYNYNINMDECQTIIDDPEELCKNYETLKGGYNGFGEGYKTDGFNIDGG